MNFWFFNHSSSQRGKYSPISLYKHASNVMADCAVREMNNILHAVYGPNFQIT